MEMRLIATASTGTTVPSSPHRFFVSRNASLSSRCSNSLLKPRLGSLSHLLPARMRSRRSIGPRLGAVLLPEMKSNTPFRPPEGFLGLSWLKSCLAIDMNCEIKSLAPYGVFAKIASGREAVKVGDRVDVKLIEINDKGQLRPSRRALLPDSESVEIMQSGDVSAEVTSKADSTEDSSDEEGSELSQDKASASNPAGSPQPIKKLVRRLVSPEKEKSLTSKVKRKKSVNKAVSSIYTKEESGLVNGEAKVG